MQEAVSPSVPDLAPPAPDYQTLRFGYRRSADQDAAQPVRHPVVVVGAGPVGLATAIDLAQSGTPVVVVNGLGHPPTHLAAAMMLLALSWSAGTFTTARLSVRLGVAKLLRLGTGLIMAGGGLSAEHVPWLVRSGVRAFHIGSPARPGRSFKAYVDAELVASWRDLIDDEVAHARSAR